MEPQTLLSICGLSRSSLHLLAAEKPDNSTLNPHCPFPLLSPPHDFPKFWNMPYSGQRIILCSHCVSYNLIVFHLNQEGAHFSGIDPDVVEAVFQQGRGFSKNP
jgi:hypothetical protein